MKKYCTDQFLDAFKAKYEKDMRSPNIRDGVALNKLQENRFIETLIEEVSASNINLQDEKMYSEEVIKFLIFLFKKTKS